ncbi:hypothetical protein DEU56DRAFT_810880 [Suillus clintonianus]|uniref:uncharacterized protein n=1 Tax=Suillus clintonianus TaxID=1904413 RepID=UPI001B872191|nr:uncharacterized protein DEU56DRAFT_810880 [Suillus clintonianus]KAG2133300.1 hypothetical protein DEU56DRAFT_810880 [Suillus clintonianus]
MFIERLVACMDSSMPYRLCHIAVRAAYSFRGVLTSIDAVDDADTILTRFSSAIVSAVCPRPGATPADDGPDGFINGARDLCYLELVFALAGNSIWHPHLVGDHHIDRCISIIGMHCEGFFMHYTCYLVGVLRIAPEQVSVASLVSITEEQCWDMIRRTWTNIYSVHVVDLSKDADDFFPVLVGGTKKYMQIASTFDLEQLIKDVDRVARMVEQPGLEYIDDMKELVTAVRDMLLQRLGQ